VRRLEGVAEFHCRVSGAIPTQSQSKSKSKSTAAGEGARPTQTLDIQVLYVEGVVFDEFSAGFYVFAH
jgi:hypothetical protein